jgi:uncharacterized protein (TIGR02246 family)
MTRTILATVLLALTTAACQQSTGTFDPNQIIAMERAALDRWGKGDPQGFFEIMAPEATYFDPNLDRRLDGAQAIANYIKPFTGKIKVDRYDMINPTVQHHGDIAILTFNLVSYLQPPGSPVQPTVRWNSTETYARINGQWRIIHSHWSYLKPELKQAVSEES